MTILPHIHSIFIGEDASRHRRYTGLNGDISTSALPIHIPCMWPKLCGEKVLGEHAMLHKSSGSRSQSKFVAPCTTPTTLYRFEKKVTQSFSVSFSLSDRSCQSGLTSSGFVEVLPRALDASLPAKAVCPG